ncbi:MAG TPA: branched-chain amino acid ABC transporter permease [Amycolatopsis sp.]|uniref:branched-chain amino acid ABC transporter permease n=1 Tax=Amycolatopsis sp. TaxID=37632 RepID=UPI002B4749C4|nr:branched-chain amino acid ABC transporter permease [Amycolatopsis sp.]HKS44873.1 branched-chain amino acid ABC transporter permease [Amycolatopsis sp.]
MAATTTLARPALTRRDLVQRAATVVIVAGVLVWLGLNLTHAPAQFFTAAADGLNIGLLYALIALGYTMVYGIIELINFAHGDLFMLGTLFSGLMLTTVLHQTTSGPVAWLLFIATLVVTMGFCGFVNVSIEFLAYRRLRRAPKLAPLITAVGISFILQFVGLKWNGSTPKQWPSVLPEGGLNLAGVQLSYSFLVVAGVTIPLLLLMQWVVTRTRQGKAMRATAQDQDAARLMGINVNRTISFTFMLGGAMAGAAGVMYQQVVGTTAYNLGYQMGLIAFTSAVLGGIGNITGAVLGGVLIGLIQGFNDGLPYGLGQQWSQSVVFTILILLMVFRPEGLLGRPTTEKV